MMNPVTSRQELEGGSVYRCFRDYRLAAPPSDWNEKQHKLQYDAPRLPVQTIVYGDSCNCDCVSDRIIVTTGAETSPARGGTGPLHTVVTPMGSTTKLISENRSAKVPWCQCLPSLGSVMVVLSLTASLGNIIRLPTIVFHNGDGTFLLVYISLALIIGIPLVFLEVVLGQFCQEGTTKLWRAVPLLKGVGLVKVLSSFLVAIYYPVIMGVALFYAAWSAKGPVPFSECSYNILQDAPDVHTSAETCLQHTFLKPPDKDPIWFGVNIALLFVIWAVVVLCMSRSTRSYKVCAFFIFIPVVGGIIALLIEELMIDSRGLDKLLKFDLKPLLTFDTWYYAMIQLFFSTHIGFGNITTCAGRLYSKSNAFWTAVLYMLCNVAVGVAFVCVVYLWVGRLEASNVKFVWPRIPELFVLTLLYDVITNCFHDNLQIWSILGFLLLVFSGLNSMAAIVFTVIESIMIETKERWKWWMITAGVCTVAFLAGIICLLPVKLELVHMLDRYVVGHMVAASTALELIGFVWIYGSFALYSDFEFVLGQKLNPIWSVVWFLTPILLVVLEIWSLVVLPFSGTHQQHDAQWLNIMGWIFYSTTWCIILFVAFWQIFTQVDYNIGQKLLSTLKPSRNWGPVDPIYRHGWVVWRGQSTISGERDFTLKRRGTRDYTHSVKRAHSQPKGTNYYPHSNQSSPSNTGVHRSNGTSRNNEPPFIVQLPQTDLNNHVCWRKDNQINGKS
ncbi:sodium-dependent nutrient amino acid transporter 1-like isoform X2 [Lycorma delicatula]